ncbi:MAG: hypothetical protein ACI4RH_07115, partial [Huintestinicola sp.]
MILGDGRRVGYKTYQNVLQLWEGSYLSRTKQSFYDWGVIALHFEAMRLLGELKDTIKPLPSIDGQMNLISDYEAGVTKPSAFTFSQEIIDAVLARGSGVSEGKLRIYEQFQKSLSKKENADFLKNEYGWGGSYPVIVGTGIDEQHDGKGIRISKGVGNDKPYIDLNWNQVEKRIGELIKMDRYLNPKEKGLYPEWLEKQELRRAEAAEERRRREILSTAPTKRKEQEQSIYTYEYHLGNTVYLGANEYEILNFDDNRVVLNDTQFPLMNKEMSREEFDRRVSENPMNDHLKVKALQTEEKTAQTDTNTALAEDETDAYNALPYFNSMPQDNEVIDSPYPETAHEVSEPIIPKFLQPKKSKVQSFDLHPEIPMSERHNFDLANNEIEEVNKKERFHRNYAAITVLKRCQEESRFATPDEQKILSRYVGWGGIPEAFDERAGAWHTEYAMLKNILTPEEYDS